MARSRRESEELTDWADRLERAVQGTAFDADRIRVLAACDSTQDLTRELGVGAVVTAGVQRRGRGRLGRSWSDDAGAGIAISLGLPAMLPEVACMAAAVAARAAVQSAMRSRGWNVQAARIGLKFPNDLVDALSARKVGGILVEVVGELAIVGIGINVGLRSWPDDVPGISLAEIGPAKSELGRIEILERLLLELDRRWHAEFEDVREEFMQGHAPTGCRVRVEWSVTGGRPRILEGRLIDLDPTDVLRVETSEGPREIPASNARILSWRPDSNDSERSST